MPKNDIQVEIFYDGAWHDLITSDDVLADNQIVVQRGDGDESAAPRPTSITMRLNNATDMYRTTNPMSPLYGKAGVNTPLRVTVAGEHRGMAEISSWKAGQTRDFRRNPKRGKAWVDIEAGGVLQRVNQWTEPLLSPFRRYNDRIPAQYVIGYWPCEQSRGSTSLISNTPGTSRHIMIGTAPDSQYRPPSSSPLMDIGEDPAQLGAYFVPNGTSDSRAGWQVSWVARYEPLVAGEQDIFDWKTADGTAYGLYLNPDTSQVLLYSSRNGAPILNGDATSYGTYDWSQWTLFTIDMRDDGGVQSIISVNWTNYDGTQSGFYDVALGGEVTSSLVWWDMSPFSGVPPGSTVGHVIGVNVDADTGAADGADLFNGPRREAWYGYLGETAGDRFTRIMDELGLDWAMNGDPALSVPMGPQPADTVANILREIRDTEDGLLFEARGALNIVFNLKSWRYNQTIGGAANHYVLTLNALANPTGLTNLPAEVTDDLNIHNLVTVAQRDGGQFTVEDSTTTMGTQPPPDGRGEYRQTVDVNVANPATDLEQQAHWWLNRGTVDLPRFPQVVVNVAALDAADALDVGPASIGNIIEITNYREYTIRLFVIGYTEVLGTHSRTITYACAPDRQFVVGVYDDPGKRYDSRTTTLAVTSAPLSTTLSLTFTDPQDRWSQTSAYDVLCSGELIGIPIGGMSAVSGTGPYTQTATGVLRSRNDVVKTLLAGAPVRVATPARYAFGGS